MKADRKLLAKILASRLDTFLPTIIGEAQTGLVKNRDSAVELVTNDSLAAYALTLDEEKVFYRVEWVFLN